MVIWLWRAVIALLVMLLLAVGSAWLLLRGSLPRLDGELAVPGLAAPVAVERDALGVVTIDAASEADAMRALGYVHAQERYFEMDLLRRTAAGELAALFGPLAVGRDEEHRVHRFRARVTGQLPAIAGAKRAVLRAYVDGVNAGLGDLRVRPWAYLLLRARPQPWTEADSPLVGHAMYFDLQDGDNARELGMWRLRAHLPPALFALLSHDGSSWDAPLAGHVRGDAVLPTAADVDLRKLPAPLTAKDMPEAPPALGSNNFAVSGALTADGRAIVADDTHLTLRAPNIWFRVRLRYPDPEAAGGRVDVSGFSLPGMPGVVIGSNGHVAWGFTNAYGDWLDWRREPGCGIAGRVPRACPAWRTHDERIEVAGEAPRTLRVHETDWGPVLHHEPDGSALALRWVAHLPGAINLGVVDMARAGSLDDALAIAARASMPAQNLVVGDAAGRIGWRLLGPIPQRNGGCAPRPLMVADTADAAAPCAGWAVSTARAPAVIDPPSGRVWTANARVVDGNALRLVGDGGYVLGPRAKQIRDALFAKQRFDERDLLAIQLDDRALFLQRWWTLLRGLPAGDATPALRALADAASRWEGRAVPESVSYRIVRAWRLAVHERIAAGLTAPARAALGKDFERPELPQFEGVAWPLVTQRPAHLLPTAYPTWTALFEDAAREVRAELEAQGPLAERTWGERNTARICHPLAGALPAFAKGALCMPFEPLPGDSSMPRVQAPDMGASQRMVVSPGHEADGILHMPGGQSGHPLSPFWGAGHDDWVHGRPTPFLPGTATHSLRMVPR